MSEETSGGVLVNGNCAYVKKFKLLNIKGPTSGVRNLMAQKNFYCAHWNYDTLSFIFRCPLTVPGRSHLAVAKPRRMRFGLGGGAKPSRSGRTTADECMWEAR
jgi:hypothetical protein